MAFTQKLIEVEVTSGSGAFAPLRISGLRTTVHAVAGGQHSMLACDVTIYGLTLSHQNAISTLGWKGQRAGADKVRVFAGDSSGLSNVYTGTIYAAYSDYQSGPDLPVRIVAQTGAREAGLIVKPTSINSKSASTKQIMQQLAGLMGLQLEDNLTADVLIAYPYLDHDPYTQMRMLASHANINAVIDRDKLAIYPADGSRSGNATVSPQAGNLIGYPAWSSEGIRCRVVYHADLMIGGKLTIQGSAITPANGVWTVTSLVTNLQNLTPNGMWMQEVGGWTPKPGQPEPGLPR